MAVGARRPSLSYLKTRARRYACSGFSIPPTRPTFFFWGASLARQRGSDPLVLYSPGVLCVHTQDTSDPGCRDQRCASRARPSGAPHPLLGDKGSACTRIHPCLYRYRRVSF